MMKFDHRNAAEKLSDSKNHARRFSLRDHVGINEHNLEAAIARYMKIPSQAKLMVIESHMHTLLVNLRKHLR